MTKKLLFLLTFLMVVPVLARAFTYTYEGKTLNYSVLNPAIKTCEVTDGHGITGDLIIPSTIIIGEEAYTVTEIGESAFGGCEGLTSVDLPNSVTFIHQYAFSGCSNLSSANIPDSVIEIGNYAFRACHSLTSIVIGNSVIHTGQNTFEDCDGLLSAVVGDSVEVIGSNAFKNCTSLKSVTIPGSVEIIAVYAFWRCNSLKSVYYNSEDPIEGDSCIFPESVYPSATLYVPQSAISKCGAIDPWKNFSSIKAHVFADIDEVYYDNEFNANEPYEIFNLNGVAVGRDHNDLPIGIYILRQGKLTKKIKI